MTFKNFTAATLFIAILLGHSYGQTIKLGSLAPSGSPWDNGLRRIGAEWTRISGGKINLRIYPGGIAGDEEDMIRKMRIGQLNAAGITGVGLCRIFSGILAVQLPLLIRTDEELFYVLEKMKPEFEKKLEEQGFKVLTWSKVGWVHFFSKAPVVLPDDLRSQKMFVWAGDADGIQAWRDAGFHPVPLQVTDMMSALQSGMVEAFTTTPLSAASYQWFGMAGNMCGMKWAPLIGGIVVSMSTWNRIPAAMQPELVAAAQAIGNEMQTEIDEADSKAVDVMKKHGLVVHDVPKEAVKQWESATREGFEKLAGKSFDRDSFERVKSLLREFRASK